MTWPCAVGTPVSRSRSVSPGPDWLDGPSPDSDLAGPDPAWFGGQVRVRTRTGLPGSLACVGVFG